MKWSRVGSTLSVNKTNPISHFSKWNYIQFNFPCIKVDEKPNVSWLHRAPPQFWSVWEARMYSVGSVGKDQVLSALSYYLHSCLPTWSWSVWLPVLLAATQICLTWLYLWTTGWNVDSHPALSTTKMLNEHHSKLCQFQDTSGSGTLRHKALCLWELDEKLTLMSRVANLLEFAQDLSDFSKEVSWNPSVRL